MHLLNENNQLTWGMSLALYSKPYRETNGEQVNTTQGDMINRFTTYLKTESAISITCICAGVEWASVRRAI